MNLKQLSDKALLKKVDELVKEETALLTVILHHLREVERRRLYSELGFKSLFDYAVKHLAYSEDQAFRRVAAMRLLQEFPQLEPKIADGTLSLANVSLAQTLFRQDQKSEEAQISPERKLEILSQLENQTKRNAEAIIFNESKQIIDFRPDKMRALTPETMEFRFVGPTILQNKIDRVKGLFAHSKPGMGLAETLEHTCDFTIAKLDPARRPRRSVSGPGQKHSVNLRSPDVNPPSGSQISPMKSENENSIGRTENSGLRTGSESRISFQNSQSSQSSSYKYPRRDISSSLRQEVWKRANSRCENCKSTYALEIDHRIPIGLGGTNRPDNLRLLCRNCNQRKAINAYGMKKMEKHLEKDSGA